MKWYAVNETLPNHNETVLAFNEAGYCVVIFVDAKTMQGRLVERGIPEELIFHHPEIPYYFASQEVSGNSLNQVTHWTRLPESIEDLE